MTLRVVDEATYNVTSYIVAGATGSVASYVVSGAAGSRLQAVVRERAGKAVVDSMQHTGHGRSQKRKARSGKWRKRSRAELEKIGQFFSADTGLTQYFVEGPPRQGSPMKGHYCAALCLRVQVYAVAAL